MPEAWQQTRLLLRQDRKRLFQLRRHWGAPRSCCLFLHPSFICVLLARLSRLLLLLGLPAGARLLRLANQIITGADIAPEADIGEGLVVIHPAGVIINGKSGRNLTIDGFGVLMPDETCPDATPPVVGEGLFIGRHGQIIGNLQVADGISIPPGQTVTRAPGNGAQLRRQRNRTLAIGSHAQTTTTDMGHAGSQFPCTRHQRLAALGEDLGEDILHYIRQASDYNRGGEGIMKKLSALLTPQVSCILLHRFSHWFHVNGRRRIAGVLSGLNFFLHKVTISPESCIGGGLYIPHPVGVTFYGQAGRKLILYAGCACTPDFEGENGHARTPVLGDAVTVGSTAIILGGVRIGSGCRIGPSTVLSTDLQPGTAAMGPGMLPDRTARREKKKTAP